MTNEHNYFKKNKGFLTWRLKSITGITATGKAISFLTVSLLNSDYSNSQGNL